MSNLSLIVSSVLAVFLSILTVGLILMNQAAKIKNKKRLIDLIGERRYSVESNKNAFAFLNSDKFSKVIDKLQQLSVPEAGWQNSPVSKKFVQAGFRNPNLLKNFFAYKTASAIALFLIGFLLVTLVGGYPLSKMLFFSLISGALGYYGPNFYLSYRIQQRSDEMLQNLPDFLDLLVICTESGLSVDAAINRVSQEIAKNSPIIGEEFYLTALEIRAGSGRIEALRNLSLRIRLDELQSLVSMLIQADKFGTSFADSLKIQSDLMRTKRMQKAEELAAKIPVKMLIPLVLCIFPVFLIVILAPLISKMSGVFN